MIIEVYNSNSVRHSNSGTPRMTKATDMRAHHDRVKLVIVRVQYASRRPGTRTACNTWYTPAGHAYGGPAPYASSSSLLLPFATPAGTPTCTLATATPAAARRGTPTPASARNHRWSALCTAATCHPETRPEQPGHARTGKGGHEQRSYTSLLPHATGGSTPPRTWSCALVATKLITCSVNPVS